MHITQGFERAVQQHPTRTATICDGRKQNFAQLHERVARMAGGMQSMGLSRTDRIAILSFNSDHFLEAYLSVAWLGAVVVPVNYRWSVAEICYSLNDARCDAIIVDEGHHSLIDAIRTACPAITKTMLAGTTISEKFKGLIRLESLLDADKIENQAGNGNDLLGIFYTGGTTGKPKGVMLSHSNLCVSGLSMLSEGLFSEGCVGLHVAPMFHLADMLMTSCLLLRGCTHVMLPAFSPDTVLSTIAEHHVTDILMVPAMLQAVVDHPGLNTYDRSSLVNILYGASPASETLLARTAAAFPQARLTQGYGMTESSGLISVLPSHQHVPGSPRLRSAGRSTYDVMIRIVDQDGQQSPRGQVGEIIFRGPNVMLGYLGKSEASDEALRGGWMHTGDMGWMDDEGYVYIVDRAKDMILSGGENIYCAEVENAIASHPAVAANAVIGIPHPAMGEAVHGVIVLRPDHDLTLEALQEHCRTLIAGYKLPRSLEFRNALPISGAGKVLKIELREPYWQGRERAIA